MDVPKKLVRSLVLHFSAVAGWEGRKPYITLDLEEFERIRVRRGFGNPCFKSDYGATITSPAPVVWINPERHKTWQGVVGTCAHEALHVVAGPQHPADFEPRVKRLLRNLPPE